MAGGGGAGGGGGGGEMRMEHVGNKHYDKCTPKMSFFLCAGNMIVKKTNTLWLKK